LRRRDEPTRRQEDRGRGTRRPGDKETGEHPGNEFIHLSLLKELEEERFFKKLYGN
jgi:hypothetical protein